MQAIQYGTNLNQAQAGVILVHGRGASAHDMLPLAQEIAVEGLAFLAPQAPGNAWYPYPFMSPIQQNEPYLTNALRILAEQLVTLASAGITAERVMLVGFSQGACLATEFVARNARRYGGVAGLSGGLIGPAGTPRDYPGTLDDTPVFLGCSDVDPHIPLERVRESERVLRDLGGDVTTRIYPGMEHTVNEDELEFLRGMVRGLVKKTV